MKHILTLLTVFLLAPMVALHAKDQVKAQLRTMKRMLAILGVVLLVPWALLSAQDTAIKLSETDQLVEQGKYVARQTSLLPTGWDAALAGDEVMRRLVKVTAPKVKGAHDAEFVCVGERQGESLQKAGFTKVEAPEVQLFPGEINRVSLYSKAVKTGERLQFKKMVLLVSADGAQLRKEDRMAPSVITNPGAKFQDDARPGAMIIGMDRTPK
jgi:hypothetical protein